MRDAFAPRKGWRRGIEYLGRRIQRLPDTPHSIALGLACGVYASFTPFFGLHFAVAAALAWLLRANLFSSAIGTLFGNPITFPFIMGSSLKLGALILGTEESAGERLMGLDFFDQVAHLFKNIGELVLPYLVGGVAPGAASATVCYFLIKPLIKTYQKRRRAKLLKRAKARLAAPEPAE